MYDTETDFTAWSKRLPTETWERRYECVHSEEPDNFTDRSTVLLLLLMINNLWPTSTKCSSVDNENQNESTCMSSLTKSAAIGHAYITAIASFWNITPSWRKTRWPSNVYSHARKKIECVWISVSGFSSPKGKVAVVILGIESVGATYAIGHCKQCVTLCWSAFVTYVADCSVAALHE